MFEKKKKKRIYAIAKTSCSGIVVYVSAGTDNHNIDVKSYRTECLQFIFNLIYIGIHIQKIITLLLFGCTLKQRFAAADVMLNVCNPKCD